VTTTTLRWKIAQLVELQWWKNYLHKRTPAEYLGWKRNYWLNLLQTIKAETFLKPTAKILDAGCGPAGIFMALPQYEVHAIDPLLDAYEKNLAHFNPSMYANVCFNTSTLESYTNTQHFDTVFCLNAINHVANLPACFDKLAALTAPNGTLVLSIDAHNYAFFKHTFRWLPSDVLHPHQYDLREYQHFLQKRGFTIQQCHCLKTGFFFDYYVLVAQR